MTHFNDNLYNTKSSKISRRDFIGKTIISTASLALTPVSAALLTNSSDSSWPKDAKKYTFFMIGHGHLDPVWLWPWSEGVSIVHSTFRSAIDRMNETPGVVFVSTSAVFYQWIADNDPDMLEEIKQRIKDGSWNVVGGWWVEPDVNLPSGEALVRQGLYGQRTLEKLVGQRAIVGFNADSFGHPVTLPQIIQQQGMDNYVFMRPQAHEKPLPADLFWWESPDGSRVLTYHIQESYADDGNMNRQLEYILKLAPNQPMTDFMGFYGIGDHGGGPTKAAIRSINELKADKNAPVIQFSSMDHYFNTVRSKNLNLPVVKDDLQIHAVGCYSADVEIKKNNRLSEAALVTAEKISTVGSLVWGAHYPKDKFTEAWKQVLLLQFHDSLSGTSLADHSQDAREGYNFALNIARTATTMAVQKLEWQIPSENDGSQYLVVFNPHAWEIKANIEYEMYGKEIPKVTDDRGQILPVQYVQSQVVFTYFGGRKRVLFNVSLPALGYRQIRFNNGESIPESKVKAENNRLENEFYRLSFSPDGQIGIFDKEAGKEVFKGGATGCKGIVIDDQSDTWSHNVRDFTKSIDDYVTKGEIGTFGNAQLRILENGPLRAAIRVKNTYGNSDLTIVWMLTAGSRNIEAHVTLNWHEKLKLVKFSFPVDVDSPQATYEVPYGVIVRETNGHENVGQRWIDLTGKRDAETCGLTLFNDAKYGYSVHDNDMRITVSRSALYAHHEANLLPKMDLDDNHYWQDQGIQTFRLMLTPHKGGWQDINAPRIAEEFITPPVAIYQGIHGGKMPASASFLSVDVPNVIVSAIKFSEDHNDGIIRLVETMGKDSSVTLKFPSVNFQWKGTIKAFEIKTLRVDTSSGNIKEVNLLEE